MRLCLVGHSAEGLVGNTPGAGTRRLAFLATPLGRRGNQVTPVVPGSGGKEGRLELKLTRFRGQVGTSAAAASFISSD